VEEKKKSKENAETNHNKKNLQEKENTWWTPLTTMNNASSASALYDACPASTERHISFDSSVLSMASDAGCVQRVVVRNLPAMDNKNTHRSDESLSEAINKGVLFSCSKFDYAVCGLRHLSCFPKTPMVLPQSTNAGDIRRDGVRF